MKRRSLAYVGYMPTMLIGSGVANVHPRFLWTNYQRCENYEAIQSAVMEIGSPKLIVLP